MDCDLGKGKRSVAALTVDAVDRRADSGRRHTACTATKIDEIKDLEPIFFIGGFSLSRLLSETFKQLFAAQFNFN